MHADMNIAAVAALIADGTRAAFLNELMDGRAFPAGELARRAGVSASTASTHLARLVEGGLVAVQQSGRHRYYRLAGPVVAGALEALALIAPPLPVRSLRQSEVAGALRAGRTCYDHLAGGLGVKVTQALVDRKVLAVSATGFDLTSTGEQWFVAFGIDLAEVRGRRRAFAARCLDWSERRDHLAGALGAAVLNRFLDLGWIVRAESTRAVRVTEAGRAGLAGRFGVEL